MRTKKEIIKEIELRIEYNSNLSLLCEEDFITLCIEDDDLSLLVDELNNYDDIDFVDFVKEAANKK